MTWRMRIACWITKDTNTHTEYVMLIAFPLQERLHECACVMLFVCTVSCCEQVYLLRGTSWVLILNMHDRVECFRCDQILPKCHHTYASRCRNTTKRTALSDSTQLHRHRATVCTCSAPPEFLQHAKEWRFGDTASRLQWEILQQVLGMVPQTMNQPLWRDSAELRYPMQ